MTMRKKLPRGKFVNQKINKIRWRPAPSQSGRIAGSLFLTGSWDDEQNAIKLWSWDKNEEIESNDITEPNLKALHKV